MAGAKSIIQNNTEADTIALAYEQDPVEYMGNQIDGAKSVMTAHHWVTGGIAFVALLACILMGLRTFFSDMQGYEPSLNFIRKWLIVPTIIYFIGGTYWRILKEKE